MGVNRDALGKTYQGSWEVTGAQMSAYARATEDVNPRYEEGAGQVAPPLFVVVPMMPVLMETLWDPELEIDMLRLVHGEQEIEWVRPIEPGETLTVYGEFAGLEDRSSGQVLEITHELRAGVEVVARLRGSMFVRGSGGKGARSRRVGRGPASLEVRQVVGLDQTQRYAEASGDHNPIHLDPEVAQAAGLPGVILHGLCTMAFASRVVVDALCEGDPRGLEAMGVRFRRPVLLGEELTVRVWVDDEEEGGRVSIEVARQDGEVVLGEAWARLVSRNLEEKFPR